MKRIYSLLIAMALCLVAVSCSSDNDEPKPNVDQNILESLCSPGNFTAMSRCGHHSYILNNQTGEWEKLPDYNIGGDDSMPELIFDDGKVLIRYKEGFVGDLDFKVLQVFDYYNRMSNTELIPYISAPVDAKSTHLNLQGMARRTREFIISDLNKSRMSIYEELETSEFDKPEEKRYERQEFIYERFNMPEKERLNMLVFPSRKQAVYGIIDLAKEKFGDVIKLYLYDSHYKNDENGIIDLNALESKVAEVYGER